MLFENMDSNILKNNNGLMLLKKIEVHYIFINYLFGPDLKYTKMTQSNYFFVQLVQYN